MPRLGSLTLLVFVLSAVVTGVRILVDDSNPLWIYTGAWNAISPSNPCPGCLISIDPSRALNRTWHDTAFVNTVRLSFSGVSIEVYTMCPPPLDSGSVYEMNYTFSLDSVPDGNFYGSSCTKTTYNYLVYARKNLTMGQHVFALTNNEAESRANSSLLLLDYAIYDDGNVETPVPIPPPPPQSPHSFPLPAVIAPAVAAAVLLLSNVFLFFYYRRHRDRRPVQEKHTELTTDMPVVTATGGFALESLATQPSLVASQTAPSSQAPLVEPPSLTTALLGSSAYSRPTNLQGHSQRDVPATVHLRERSEDLPYSSYAVVPGVAQTSRLQDTSLDLRTGTEVAPASEQPSDTKEPDTPAWLPPTYQGHWGPGSKM